MRYQGSELTTAYSRLKNPRKTMRYQGSELITAYSRLNNPRKTMRYQGSELFTAYSRLNNPRKTMSYQGSELFIAYSILKNLRKTMRYQGSELITAYSRLINNPRKTMRYQGSELFTAYSRLNNPSKTMRYQGSELAHMYERRKAYFRPWNDLHVPYSKQLQFFIFPLTATSNELSVTKMHIYFVGLFTVQVVMTENWLKFVCFIYTTRLFSETVYNRQTTPRRSAVDIHRIFSTKQW